VLLTLVGYVAVFVAMSAFAVRRRDVVWIPKTDEIRVSPGSEEVAPDRRR
jgi:hypothetical protein